MLFVGTLTMAAGNSRLNGTLLARKSAGDPFGNATTFLVNQGLTSGFIQVTGQVGVVGRTPVIFITAARSASGRSASAAVIAMRKAAGNNA